MAVQNKYAGTPYNRIATAGGSVRVTIAATVGQGNGGTSLLTRGCYVNARTANTGPVTMNIDVAASASVGIELPEGRWEFVPIDDVSKLYFYSATNGDIIDILYLRG